MHPNIHYNTIFNSQNLEETHMSIDRWMNKEDMACVCVCVIKYSAVKKNEMMLFAAT